MMARRGEKARPYRVRGVWNGWEWITDEIKAFSEVHAAAMFRKKYHKVAFVSAKEITP